MNSQLLESKAVKLMGRWKAVVILAVLFIVLSLGTENFIKPGNLVSILGQSAAYMVLALGVTMTIISAGCDLSVGGMMCLAGIITIGLQPYMPTWAAALLAVAAGALVGFVNGFFVVHQKTEAFIITLGMGMLLKGVNLVLLDGNSIYGTDEAFARLGSGSVLGVPYVVVVALLLVAVFYFVMSRTSYGRNLYAIGGDYDVAVNSGINAVRQKWLAFVISGMMAAVGGIIFSSRMNAASAIFGDRTALVVNCSVVIGGTSFVGGVGGILQSVIGVVLLNVIENGMNLLKFNSYVQMLVEGLVIVMIITIDLYSAKVKRQRV